MRAYKCLNINIFSNGAYSLIPIRDEDKYEILNWRNSQIDILRQQKPLTIEQQDDYFNTTVAGLFNQEQPEQILWSFLLNGKLIGYGGLVHINWINKTAEISFLTETSRNQSKDIFISDWVNYLNLVKKITSEILQFNAIYTYAYDIRPNLYVALEKSGFKETKRIKNNITINNQKDVVIHTFNIMHLQMRMAELSDVDLYFEWANDSLVRQNSFSSEEINYQQHVNWFTNKLNSSDCYFYLFFNSQNNPVGQIRIDKSDNEKIIGISIDKKFRGKGLGVEMLNIACNNYQTKFPNEEIIAYIKENNVASINQFSKAGFIFTGHNKINKHECLRYKK